MANTNSPQFNTYKTVEVKFDNVANYRHGNLAVQRDSNIINMYYDRVSQENKTREVRLKKRPGLISTAYSLRKTSSSAVIRGSFYDVDQNAFYWAVNDKVYNVLPDTGVTRTVATLSTTSGYVGFCSFLQQTTSKKLVCFTDGIELWIDDYAATSCTKVTDPDLPTPHQPHPLYINGYLLLVKTNTNDMYNSDVDDPFTWTTSNLISAEISSDNIVRIFKWRNYVVALGNNSVEYFWDAGNTTGSPFSRNDSPFRAVGYVTGGVQISDAIYFVGQDENYNLGVYQINNFKIDRISNSVVDRSLQAFSNSTNGKGNVNLNKDGFCISVDGHTFYVLVTTQTTWLYDVDEKIWYEWRGNDNTYLKIEATIQMRNGQVYTAIAGRTTWAMFTQEAYDDFGINFTCQYTTENTMFDTFNWKVCHRLALECSMHQHTGTSYATIYWSDNDWADGGTAGRTVNVFSSSPYITRGGKFRNRSFRVTYADNYPFFMTGLRLDINVLGI